VKTIIGWREGALNGVTRFRDSSAVCRFRPLSVGTITVRVSNSVVVARVRRSDARGPESAFGRALREIREEKGMAQEKLARAATLDRTYVSMIERGVRSPTIRTVVRLAEVLDVRPSEIVQRMENLLPNRRRSAQADMRPPNPRM